MNLLAGALKNVFFSFISACISSSSTPKRRRSDSNRLISTAKPRLCLVSAFIAFCFSSEVFCLTPVLAEPGGFFLPLPA